MKDFHFFADAVAERLRTFNDNLFKVEVEDIFTLYLDAFPEGTNPIFRERTEHDCSCCKNFLRNMGNVVRVTPDGVETLFDDLKLPEPYQTVANTLDSELRERPVQTIFRTTEPKFGAKVSRELLDDGTVRNWDHFYGDVPQSARCADPATQIGQYNTNLQVLRRSFDEFKMDAFETVLDLMSNGALYRGDEFKAAVLHFRDTMRVVNTSERERRDRLIALNAQDIALSRFRNSVIGTLITDLSNGIDLEKAVYTFEQKVAPQNYKRPTALITERMVKDALTTISDLNLSDSIERRYARLSDVSVNDVLFASSAAQTAMRGRLESLLMDQVRKPTKVSEGSEISIQDFIKNVVPEAGDMSLILDNKHTSNFMSLTAPVHAEAPPLFAWDNGFAWSYDGEVTDTIKERVKRAGGKVDAPIRFSLTWGNKDDLDLHCITPSGGRIFFGDMRSSGGHLDVDIIHPRTPKQTPPVENIYFDRLRDGVYKIEVDRYSKRSSVDVGCEVEIEIDGFGSIVLSHEKALGHRTPIATVTIENGVTTVQAAPNVVASNQPTDKWGVTTQRAIPVSSLMLSPNYWGGREQGNRHYFFILAGCRNPGEARGIYNEFLRPDLTQHRKVFEVLGSKSKCAYADDQLSGVGFSSTQRNAVTALVNLRQGGQRTFTVKF